ncbi:MAG: peptide-methionine (R)-S-oxide reductase MsrB [Methylococcales bacterium]|nr:peptide-methionine (R)-S-oxide reductase MsrB [Methylococcales bacterium]
MAWGSDTFKKPAAEELEHTLTSLQYDVTQNEGTEKPFNNDYWDNKAAGIYVDVVSGEPLFSSLDKYDSGTGWPSFTKPLLANNVTTKIDKGLFYSRTEVRSHYADSHLGHVFDDGPKEAGGKRFCMNSAALRFIPVAKLAESGYGDFLPLFQPK